MQDYKIKIENVVASTQIGENIDLNKISREIKDSEYKPKQFPGLVLRTKEPKAAALVFRSGKVVCTGSKSVEDARRAVKQIVKMLKEIGISVIDEPEVKVQNIVASADLGVDLNLNAIAIGLGLENIEYEPEQFPGLVYRLDNPRVVVLIFGSGKMVVTGGKSPEDARKAVERISEELRTLGLM
ncbi:MULTISPECIES: TATA-box-binding protein [Archaeoglobus]|jgi:transcription initiation factor TFIID TATA-box-binding protein|uniref:TATA-box-binding protein n=3 Tax=Archaeoglobus fulgidus TaxID=2234 RepID=TBP_ARCFU|nr:MULTISPECIES: TATA-box-binding protein [Archaeoglobus]O29874.1 RecName: Full=TATA-box-binding protein; AltName: Full=Box A-binding protein; Short=BAP; AltName: Full=TATA sequence-binding protein; Short=TBP; AltName: Full=TATA-box factor [Archaeoglobus fulgidus DSM 4304]AAB90862.1 transcription initiation factor IID [Archaeoglobus fulgidus DSM 4304]AIG97192.1 TATA-box binding protein (TBP), component of TFIID and TFIIIB [Archaeoglobus fulgidus DSM 8774]KUJ94347.1 MAG: TATA-box-binding protein